MLRVDEKLRPKLVPHNRYFGSRASDQSRVKNAMDWRAVRLPLRSKAQLGNNRLFSETTPMTVAWRLGGADAGPE